MKKKLLCAGLMTLFLVGCGTVTEAKPQRANGFSTISCNKLDGNFYQIVRDNETGIEYIVVSSYQGTGVTRRYK